MKLFTISTSTSATAAVAAVALVVMLTGVAAPADGPLRLDGGALELGRDGYHLRQLHNTSRQALLVQIEVVDMIPRWWAQASPWSAELGPGESLVIGVGVGVGPLPDMAGAYAAQLRVRAVQTGAELPPFEGESWRSPEEHERLGRNVVQTLSIPVRYAAE